MAGVASPRLGSTRLEQHFVVVVDEELRGAELMRVRVELNGAIAVERHEGTAAIERASTPMVLMEA